MGTKPSPDPVLKWPEWDQNGAIGPPGRITRDAWTPGLKNGTKMPRKKGTKNRGRATIRRSNGANSWCRRIYKEEPRHLCHINRPPSVPLFLCVQRKTATTASVFVPVYSTASKICTIHIKDLRHEREILLPQLIPAAARIET